MTEELINCVSDVVGRVEVCQKSSRYLIRKQAFITLLRINCIILYRLMYVSGSTNHRIGQCLTLIVDNKGLKNQQCQQKL